MQFRRPSIVGALAFVCVTLGMVSSLFAQSASIAVAAAAPPEPPSEMLSVDPDGRMTLRASRLEAPLAFNGRLDDEIYRLVSPAGHFTKNDTGVGMPATEQTDVWVFFDDDNIYVSARCWDSEPAREVANERRRDNQGIQNNDNFVVVLDTFYDHRNGYFFQTNPVGGLRDQQVTDEGAANNVDWNAVWDAKVNRDDKGWTTEMVIPFKSLRFKATGPQTWGLNFRRIVKWKNETSFLAPVPASYDSKGIFKFSLAATLVGVDVPAESRNFELKPYGRSGVLTNLQAKPAVSNDFTRDAGFDVKYGLTKGLTADFTVNTDFAQVEEDEQQVNLTRFNLFFPEKREFFLEGRGIFNFGGVDTRGSGNSLTPLMFFSRQIGIANGQPVPIRGGARVTGRTGKYTVGLLNIETGASDDRRAPTTNFSTVRIRRDILRRSAVGVIGTYRPQRLNGAPGSNQLVGLDANLAFFRNVTIDSFYARTRTPGYTTDESSYMGKLEYGADRYGLNLEHLLVGEGFNPEMGFMRRQAFRRSYVQARFSPRPQKSRTIRKFVYEGTIEYITDPHGHLESREDQGAFRIERQNSDTWSNDFHRYYEFLARPFTVASGIVVAPGGYEFREYTTNYNLGSQHRVSGNLNFGRGSFYDGTRTTVAYYGRLDLGSRLGMEPRVSINWIDLPAGKFTSKVVSSRVGLTMTPRMALTGLLQYNSSSSALTSNIRFRWEYQPGSDLFVVYSDGRDTAVTGFPTLQNRTFVVKATRLFRW